MGLKYMMMWYSERYYSREDTLVYSQVDNSVNFTAGKGQFYKPVNFTAEKDPNSQIS